MDSAPRELLSGNQFLKAVTIGAAGGLALVGAPYAVGLLFKILLRQDAVLASLLTPNYGITLLLILPMVQAVLAGMVAGRYQTGFGKYAGITFSILAIDYILAMGILREGTVCLIMAMPLFVGIMAIGLAIGRVISHYRHQRLLRISLLPLVVLAVGIDTQSPAPEYSGVVSDAVTINASPENVWRYIVEHPENTTPPDYWLWQIGMPMPIQSVASGLEVGAERDCKFTGGIAFHEEITELVPNRVLTFKVTAQPDHPEIIGHFSLDKGQLYLEANPDGTTTVIATSWYRIYVRPAEYFDWWASDIVRKVHFRVLDHIKDLAETDEHAQLAML